MSEWQDISTAPKDGEYYLLCDKNTGSIWVGDPYPKPHSINPQTQQMGISVSSATHWALKPKLPQ